MYRIFLLLFLLLPGQAFAGNASLSSHDGMASDFPDRPDRSDQGRRDICSDLRLDHPLSLLEVVKYTLCKHPQLRGSRAAADVQQALLGVSEAARYPSLNGQGGLSGSRGRSGGVNSDSSQQSLSLSASYLLYDFGGREASVESARQLLQLADANRDALLQNLFLTAVQAYYALLTASANVEALLVAEKFTQQSLHAAEARKRAGIATSADQLQAKTALSQATLNRITGEGTLRSAQGSLAHAMGLQPTQVVSLAAASDVMPDPLSEQKIGELIELAQQQRPDLLAAEAQLRAGEASIAASRAADMPQISLDSTVSATNNSSGGINSQRQNGSIGLNITVPIFTGYRNRYQIAVAEARLAGNIASRDQLANQIALDVWKAFQGLQTSSEALRASADLVASAEQSEKMATGRYGAGVGNIIELLNAQSALATAHQQQIAARYNWQSAKFILAQAIGLLDANLLSGDGESERE
ncbi:MAG: hypothetical protein AUJ56_08425 [Zetaproteobacteria bacterium CG1_02_49_23]|nr:MAG: hypothetical protein AUJ56_08425 [Zetaproteobacteria bacterium CG1_02_49_23]